MSLGAKAKSFFGNVKDALKDAATIELNFDDEESRIKGTVQLNGSTCQLPIFNHEVLFALMQFETTKFSEISSGASERKDRHNAKVMAAAVPLALDVFISKFRSSLCAFTARLNFPQRRQEEGGAHRHQVPAFRSHRYGV
jgi:hypothetical protein